MKRLAASLSLLVLACCAAPATAGAASDSPHVIRVRTEPAVSGIALTFKGRRYVTDSEGRAVIARPRGVTASDLLPRIAVGSRNVDARTVVRFARWFQVGPDSVAALDVFRRVGWQFFDTSGAVVPPGKIGRLVLRSTTGEVRVWRTGLGRSHLLFARRVSLIGGRLVPKNVGYSVQRITVLGTDVVNSGQQTFLPERQRVVPFTLAFFTLTVRGEDALFGSAVGTRARLELPDGSTRELRLVDGQTVISSLPRGTYRITLEDGVYRMSQPLVLSRSQVLVVPVVTYVDLITVGGGLLVAALGLLLIGRPYLARRTAARIAAGGRGANRPALVTRNPSPRGPDTASVVAAPSHAGHAMNMPAAFLGVSLIILGVVLGLLGGWVGLGFGCPMVALGVLLSNRALRTAEPS